MEATVIINVEIELKPTDGSLIGPKRLQTWILDIDRPLEVDPDALANAKGLKISLVEVVGIEGEK